LAPCFNLKRSTLKYLPKAEFHSFERQLCRLAEEHLVTVARAAAAPSYSFPDRFLAAARTGEHDLIFVSQVFYNSGATCGDIAALRDSRRRRQAFSAMRSPRARIVIGGGQSYQASKRRDGVRWRTGAATDW
jgi:kynureninase